MTAETIEDFFGWTNGKRRRLLFMKRAAGHPVRTLFLQLHVVLDYADDVSLSPKVVDERLGITHDSVGRERDSTRSSVNRKSEPQQKRISRRFSQMNADKAKS